MKDSEITKSLLIMEGAFMSHAFKYDPQYKIDIARRCIEGSLSLRSAAKEVGTSTATIHKC